MLFTFPSRYCYAISHQMYLALRDGPRGFTQDFSCPGLLGMQLPNKTHFNYGTFTPYGRPFQTASSISSIQISLSHYPSHTAGLGSSPFVRHYLGNHCYFLFLALLRCFSSRRSPLFRGDRSSTCRVAPFGNPRVEARLQLAEAYRSSPRPSSPFGA